VAGKLFEVYMKALFGEVEKTELYPFAFRFAPKLLGTRVGRRESTLTEPQRENEQHPLSLNNDVVFEPLLLLLKPWCCVPLSTHPFV
jgi:hypothetical protein